MSGSDKPKRDPEKKPDPAKIETTREDFYSDETYPRTLAELLEKLRKTKGGSA